MDLLDVVQHGQQPRVHLIDVADDAAAVMGGQQAGPVAEIDQMAGHAARADETRGGQAVSCGHLRQIMDFATA